MRNMVSKVTVGYGSEIYHLQLDWQRYDIQDYGRIQYLADRLMDNQDKANEQHFLWQKNQKKKNLSEECSINSQSYFFDKKKLFIASKTLQVSNEKGSSSQNKIIPFIDFAEHTEKSP